MADGICPNCRRTLPENARFCTECGSRIDILVTRKELGTVSSEDDGGLKINRKEPISSPFCSSYNNIRDKILNPNLAPLPEKKKFLFKSWEDIKIGNSEKVTIQEEEEIVAQSRVEQQTDGRESVDQTESLKKTVIVAAVKESEDNNSSATDMEKKSEPEESGIVSGQSSEEFFSVELQNSTDFEAIKELFAEALSNGETEGEKREVEESVENSDYAVVQDCNETLERTDAFSGGMTSGAADESDKVSFEEICPEYQRGERNLKDVTEVTDAQLEHDEERDVDETILGITEPEAEGHLVALQEEPTDFDALNALFSERIAADADEEECSQNIESYDYEESTVIQEPARESCESIEKSEDAPETHSAEGREPVDEIRITEMERDSSVRTEEKQQTVAEVSADTETVETVIGLQESVTGFESLKELFVENTSESVDELFEEDNDPESVEKAIPAENHIETARDRTESDGKYQSNGAAKTESVGQDEEETAVELSADITDFETLKGLFSGNSEEVEGGVLECCTEVSESAEKLSGVPSEKLYDMDSSHSSDFAISDTENNELYPGALAESRGNEQVMNFLADNMGERLQEQVAMEVTEKTSEQKPNRIITSTVGGGFRRKSPQAEQLKDISGLFGKKNRK